MNLIKRIKTFFSGLPRNVYIGNQAVIDQVNLTTLQFASACGVAAFGLLAVMAVLYPQKKIVLPLYITVIVILAVLLVVARLYIREHLRMARPALYCAVLVVLIAALVLGTFCLPNGNAAAFIGALALLPSLILDRPGRIGLSMAVMTAVFCVCTWLIKPADVALTDIINALCFLLCGGLLMYYMVSARLSSLISREQLEWNDARYRAILSDSDSIIFDIDLENGACRIDDRGGQPADMPLTLNELRLSERVYPADRDRWKRLLDSLDTLEESAHEKIRFSFGEGRPLWYSVCLISLMEPDGKKQRIVGKMTNIDAQERREAFLRKKSYMDSMTGVYNKTATETIIMQALDHENGMPCALLLADVDNLKYINDTLGHVQGDRAIVAFSSEIRKHFRSSDIVGRVGGDEFMVFLHGAENAEQLNSSLSQLISHLNALRVGEHGEFRLGGSIGVAFRTEAHEDFRRLYEMADTALYNVKKSTKNGYAVYSPEMDAANGA